MPARCGSYDPVAYVPAGGGGWAVVDDTFQRCRLPRVAGGVNPARWVDGQRTYRWSCAPGFQRSSGDEERSCMGDGPETWTGNPLVCTATTACGTLSSGHACELLPGSRGDETFSCNP